MSLLRAFKPALRWASPGGSHGRLSVLIFHRVLPVRDPLFPQEIDARAFDKVCRWARAMFNILPLDQAAQRLAEGTLPARALAITFDDGYADNHDVALPILARHGLPAAFFIATGYLDGGRMFNDSIIESVRLTQRPGLDLRDMFEDDQARYALSSMAQRRAAIDNIIPRIKYFQVDERNKLVEMIAHRADVKLPDDLMMTSAQVVAMRRAGMQIGAHTVSHPILARLSADDVRREMTESRRFLEQLLGERVGLFAYPNGKPELDYNASCVAAVREGGFDAAFTTAWAAGHRKTSSFEIPRFTPWDRSGWRFGWRMLNNLRASRPQPEK